MPFFWHARIRYYRRNAGERIGLLDLCEYHNISCLWLSKRHYSQRNGHGARSYDTICIPKHDRLFEHRNYLCPYTHGTSSNVSR
jgi:hypothetical protein